MAMAKLTSLVSRLFFAGAIVLVVIAAVEKVANLTGYTIVRSAYTTGRLLEVASLLIIFVIALLLRQIREELKKDK